MSKFSSCCGADETKTYNSAFPFCPTCGDNCEFFEVEETEASFSEHPFLDALKGQHLELIEKLNKAYYRKLEYPTKQNRTRYTNLYMQELDVNLSIQRLQDVFNPEKDAWISTRIWM